MVTNQEIRVFVAEDDKMWRQVITSALEEISAVLALPIAVDFISAQNAIKQLKKLKVDIAIIDGNLTPGDSDGWEGQQLIEAIKKLGSDIKIIGYSAYGQPLLEAGADAVIDKLDFRSIGPTILRLLAN